jgi:hypothetical protein
MKRGLTSLAAVAAAALALVACGDDDGDNDDPTVPELSELTVPDVSIPDISLPDTIPGGITIPDISIPDISIPDISIGGRIEDLLQRVYPDLTDEQISCIIDVTGGNTPGPEWFEQLQTECDLSAQDLIPG